ncbi:MAG: VWA domain-containing protein [Chloroflexi bacterium]|nr:MAG: VWA domain-containing protein [Chloroflexota bacterium]
MTFLAPAAAALAITLPVIVALYFLRIRRPTRVVPWLDLWPDQIRDRQANVPWQRLRFSWLLLLQLLVAGVLVAAAVQPALSASASLAAHTVVLLDASASMQAKDVQPSRLDWAKREIGAMIDQLGPQDRMTLIAMQSTARVVASGSGDHDAMHRALNGIGPSNGPADLSGALSLAAGSVRAGEDSRAYLFSDGIVEPLRTSFANGLPFPIEYHRVGVSGENLGLTSLTVRTSAQSRAAYLRVHNFGQQARTFTLEWRSDAGLIDVRSVSLAAGQAQDLALPVPDAANTVTARIDAKDNFGLDDSVTAIARAPRAFRVLLVTPGNVFLEQALRLRTDFQLDVIAPAAYRAATSYAMTVFDRFSPPALPEAPFIMVDPPAGSALAGGAAVGIGRVRASDAGDPLLTNVPLQDVHVARSQDLRASSFGRALITSVQTPLVLVRDEPYRQVLVGFDIHDSDLPLRIGFPVLMQNLSEWMLPPSVPSRSFHPDEPVTIVPETGATTVTVVRPDGSRRQLATGSIATFADTGLLGVYTVEQTVSGRTDRSWFAVNLFSDATSQL